MFRHLFRKKLDCNFWSTFGQIFNWEKWLDLGLVFGQILAIDSAVISQIVFTLKIGKFSAVIGRNRLRNKLRIGLEQDFAVPKTVVILLNTWLNTSITDRKARTNK